MNVTTPLDGPAAQHIDRIVGEVIEARDWENGRTDTGMFTNRAAIKLASAAYYGPVREAVCGG